MNPRFDAAVAAIRSEIARQGAEGDLVYRGVSPEGFDQLEGRLDLDSVARAVLAALGDFSGRREPLHAPSCAEVYALTVEADERQTERQAPNDASPGEEGGH